MWILFHWTAYQAFEDSSHHRSSPQSLSYIHNFFLQPNSKDILFEKMPTKPILYYIFCTLGLLLSVLSSYLETVSKSCKLHRPVTLPPAQIYRAAWILDSSLSGHWNLVLWPQTILVPLAQVPPNFLFFLFSLPFSEGPALAWRRVWASYGSVI